MPLRVRYHPFDTRMVLIGNAKVVILQIGVQGRCARAICPRQVYTVVLRILNLQLATKSRQIIPQFHELKLVLHYAAFEALIDVTDL